MKVSKGLNGTTSNKSVQMIELDTSKGLNIITTLKNALKRLNGTQKKTLLLKRIQFPFKAQPKDYKIMSNVLLVEIGNGGNSNFS